MSKLTVLNIQIIIASVCFGFWQSSWVAGLFAYFLSLAMAAGKVGGND